MVMQDNIFLINKSYKRKIFEFSIDELNNNFQEIFENSEWGLIFHAPEGSKLYMDGLDLIHDERILKDANGIYITPSDDPYYIYNHNENENKYLPGLYRLKLVNQSTVKYSWLKIKPKFLTENLLEVMKQDVENTVKGLARSFHANTNGSLSNYSSFLTFEEIEALTILNNSYKDFNLNTYFLSHSPRVRAGSYYHWTRNKKRNLDNKSIKKMSIKKYDKELYLEDFHATVDISENRVLKRLLLEILQVIMNVKKSIEKIPKNLMSSDLKKDFTLLQKYSSKLNYLLKEGWLRKVQIVQKEKGISNAYLDYRYIFFKDLNWKLKHISNFQPQFSRQYQYYWHRTDLLYEIWGYIKVIEALKSLGFTPVKGWIFDNVDLDFQELKPGTCVEMKTNGMYKHFMYLKIKYDDEVLPEEEEKVTLSNPLWHSSPHNRPDIRIEIYDKNMIFQSTIILDTKYRRLKNMNNFGKAGIVEQLNAYRYQLLSPYPFRADSYQKYNLFHRKNEDHQVIDVAALYPGELNDQEEVLSELKTKSTKSIVLNPRFPNNSLLKKFLKESFNQQEETFEQFEKWDEFLKDF